jgi:XTP/dITP diphosphohydrolase
MIAAPSAELNRAATGAAPGSVDVVSWRLMSPGELLLASQNKGKLHEMRILVEGLPYRVLGPADVGIHEAPDETGATFLDNARLKALHYAARSGLLTVADDSGISVDAIRGEPGLYSSRFGGQGASDEERNALLLSRLEGVPEAARTARFTCALVLARGPCSLFEVVESVEGRIAERTSGASGFGYDPLFFYPPFGLTFGEVPRQDKDRVSHRGKAFARLRAFLESLRQSGSESR